MITEIIQNVRLMRPIVHNITNYVSASDCANITLTVGASPIMADAPSEVSDVTSIADALVLNTGTLSKDKLDAMLIAGNIAKDKGIPIILDPVGAGVSKFRTNAINTILHDIQPDIIRLNASELKSICTNSQNTSGVDCTDVLSENDIIKLAKTLSKNAHAVIGVSGKTDIITDGGRTTLIRDGHEMMRLITGAGCMLSSVTGAFAAANKDNLFECTAASFAVFAHCGKMAYRDGIGTASYKNNFFDLMTNPDTEEIKIEYR